MIRAIRELVEGLFDNNRRPYILLLVGVICLWFGKTTLGEAAPYSKGPIQINPDSIEQYLSRYPYIRVKGRADEVNLHTQITSKKQSTRDYLYYAIFSVEQPQGLLNSNRKAQPLAVVRQQVAYDCLRLRTCYSWGEQVFTGKLESLDALPSEFRSTFPNYELSGNVLLLDTSWQPPSRQKGYILGLMGLAFIALAGVSAYMTKQLQTLQNRRTVYAHTKSLKPPIAPVNWDENFKKDSK